MLRKVSSPFHSGEKLSSLEELAQYLQSADFSSYTFLYKAEPEVTDYCAYNSRVFQNKCH